MEFLDTCKKIASTIDYESNCTFYECLIRNTIDGINSKLTQSNSRTDDLDTVFILSVNEVHHMFKLQHKELESVYTTIASIQYIIKNNIFDINTRITKLDQDKILTYVSAYFPD